MHIRSEFYYTFCETENILLGQILDCFSLINLFYKFLYWSKNENNGKSILSHLKFKDDIESLNTDGFKCYSEDREGEYCEA